MSSSWGDGSRAVGGRAREVVVITGAAGRIGREIIPGLRRKGRTLRLLDISPPELPRDPRDVWIRASITDRAALSDAFRGATSVVHLAGHPEEMPWAEILALNIDGSQAVLEAAYRAGIDRVFLASSYHVVGYEHPRTVRATGAPTPRPDTYYGVSKAAMEALGSVFADRYAMAIVSARIVTFGAQPHGARGLAQWLSVGDAVRLVEAAIAWQGPGHRVVWGVSDNAPAWFPLDAGRLIGYHPRDDAAEMISGCSMADAERPATANELDAHSVLGYKFVEPPWDLGVPRPVPQTPLREAHHR